MPNPEDRMELTQLGKSVFAAERILDKKKTKRGKIQYFVKWKGWPSGHNTWEPQENILDDRLIQAFESTLKAQPPKSTTGAKRGPKPKNKKVLLKKEKVQEWLEGDSETESRPESPASNKNESSKLKTEPLNDAEMEDDEAFESQENKELPKRKKLKRKRKASCHKDDKFREDDATAQKEEALRLDRDVITKVPFEEQSPIPAAFWLQRQPIADHIVITDVTVNFRTVTIRECPNKLGFFRESNET